MVESKQIELIQNSFFKFSPRMSVNPAKRAVSFSTSVINVPLMHFIQEHPFPYRGRAATDI
jgi:hypothetical protein